MRAKIIGTKEVFEVIAEEFNIPGSGEKFIVHMTIDYMRKPFVATHLETSQIVGEGETIDAAIENAKTRWQAAAPEDLADRLAERREWVAERIAATGAQP
jgi:hypothetical protein